MFNAAVSAPGVRTCSMIAPASGCSPSISRRLAKSSRASQSSASPGNWNRIMYQDRCFCSKPASRIAAR